MSSFAFRCIAILAVVSALPGWAQDEEELKDLEGSKDHPAVKRYPGSIIGEYEHREFETAKLPTQDFEDENAELQVKTKTFEGNYTRIVYWLPTGTSCTQVLRNYENAFKAGGLKVYKGKNQPVIDGGWGTNAAWVAAEGKVKGKGKTLGLLQTCDDQLGDRPGAMLIAVEKEAMDQKVEVDAGAMADELEKNGRIALYGITFATGKADITPASAKTLEEIGKLLKEKSDWKLRVEGHTDNVGKSKANLDLSKKRAEAVKSYLVKKLGIEAARLTAQGFGDTKPIGDNKTEDGKAQNRRVELAKL